MHYQPILLGLTSLAWALLVFAFWVWTLIGAINPRLERDRKNHLVIIFLPLFGVLIYSVARRQKWKRQNEQ